MDAVYALNGAYEQQKLLTKLRIRANELGFQRNFDNLWKSYCQNQAAKGIRSDNMTKFPQQLFALRCGEWETGVDGVFRMVQQGNDFKKEYASPIPIMPTEILQNQEDGTEKIRLAYFKDGSWKSIVMPRSKIANKNKILDLADFGIEVNSDNAGQLVKYIANTVALNFDILPRAKSVDHMGWAGNDFVPYTDDIKLDCETECKTLVDSIATSGTLEEWIDYIKPLRKNMYMRLILAASFASVLIAKVGALPFVLHLWGGTGSGKSTLVQLIPRLYDVTEGCVRVGGRDVREYDIETLRNAVSMVLQKNELFSGTVEENLRWGNENATMEEIRHAARVAQADGFIMAMPEGYDSEMEQGGSNVSGGQKQRLCIARALLKNPKILILDDSTSAVDTATDRAIRDAFRNEMPDVTKIIIAQRISSVQDADRIIVMDNGRITDFGTHDELLNRCCIYREVYESQQKGGGDFDEQ